MNFDRTFAMQTVEGESVTTKDAKATTAMPKTSSGTDSSNTEKLLLEIRDGVYQLYSAISSGATLELFNSALDTDFALTARGTVGYQDKQKHRKSRGYLFR